MVPNDLKKEHTANQLQMTIIKLRKELEESFVIKDKAVADTKNKIV